MELKDTFGSPRALPKKGTHYEGEDDRGDGATGTVTAAAGLRQAATALSEATQALMAAHSANGVVRWYDTPRA